MRIVLAAATITVEIEASPDLTDSELERLSEEAQERLDMGLEAVGQNITEAIGNTQLSYTIKV